MKRNVFFSSLLVLGLVLSSSSAIQAQGQIQQEYKHWNIFTNPFGYFVGNFNIGAGYAFHKNFAVAIEPTYLNAYYIDPAVTGFGVKGSFQAYFDKAWDGFYLEPGFSYYHAKQDEVGGDISVNMILVDVIAAWAWAWDSGFNATIGIGAGYWAGGSNLDTGSTSASLDYDGPTFSGKLAFGYAF